MAECNPAATPLIPGELLVEGSEEDLLSPGDRKIYQALVGSLGYLMNCSRPDMAYAMLSYVDDLQEGIYIWEPDVAKRCDMGAILEEADVEVNRIAEENYLPLEDSQHEKLVLKTREGRVRT